MNDKSKFWASFWAICALFVVITFLLYFWWRNKTYTGFGFSLLENIDAGLVSADIINVLYRLYK